MSTQDIFVAGFLGCLLLWDIGTKVVTWLWCAGTGLTERDIWGTAAIGGAIFMVAGAVLLSAVGIATMLITGQDVARLSVGSLPLLTIVEFNQTTIDFDFHRGLWLFCVVLLVAPLGIMAVLLRNGRADIIRKIVHGPDAKRPS